jgi:hypothetical protein
MTREDDGLAEAYAGLPEALMRTRSLVERWPESDHRKTEVLTYLDRIENEGPHLPADLLAFALLFAECRERYPSLRN